MTQWLSKLLSQVVDFLVVVEIVVAVVVGQDVVRRYEKVSKGRSMSKTGYHNYVVNVVVGWFVQQEVEIRKNRRIIVWMSDGREKNFIHYYCCCSCCYCGCQIVIGLFNPIFVRFMLPHLNVGGYKKRWFQ